MMLNILMERLKQGHRTMKWPAKGAPDPVMPDRFRGLPELNTDLCENCGVCSEACPSKAWLYQGTHYQLDLGCCMFCGDCAMVCPTKALRFSNQFRLARTRRQDLLYVPAEPHKELPSRKLDEVRRKLFYHSLKIRQVSAGGCNACEADANVLSTPAWDMSRFGMEFTASPRHADALLITGPITANMRDALLDTYEAMAEPKLVIASGFCAISGGPFAFTADGSPNPQICGGVDELLPVDLYVPGCPPHPQVLLDGLLALIGRVP